MSELLTDSDGNRHEIVTLTASQVVTRRGAACFVWSRHDGRCLSLPHGTDIRLAPGTFSAAVSLDATLRTIGDADISVVSAIETLLATAPDSDDQHLADLQRAVHFLLLSFPRSLARSCDSIELRRYLCVTLPTVARDAMRKIEDVRDMAAGTKTAKGYADAAVNDAGNVPRRT